MAHRQPMLGTLSSDMLTDGQAQAIVAERFDAATGIVITTRTVDIN